MMVSDASQELSREGEERGVWESVYAAAQAAAAQREGG